jgi:hypothetical protein
LGTLDNFDHLLAITTLAQVLIVFAIGIIWFPTTL